MAVAQLILEYLRVILSPQGIVALILLVFFYRFHGDVRALIGRIASIRLPGGTEVSTPQLGRATDEKAALKEPPPLPLDATPVLPSGVHLSPEQAQAVAEVFKAERARAYLWEYRYLNYFLVANTQRVLDWLAGLQERTTLPTYDAFWIPIIPKAQERRAIIDALQAHSLIALEGELITVTPKGREYIEWRGPLPVSNREQG